MYIIIYIINKILQILLKRLNVIKKHDTIQMFATIIKDDRRMS